MNTTFFILRWAFAGLLCAALVLALWGRFADTGSGLPWGALVVVPRAGYAAAVERAAPAVVSIHASTQPQAAANPLTDDPLFQHFFGTGSDGEVTRQSASLGSGVILDASGVVLTNYHVIRGSDAIRVALADGRTVAGQIVGTDPDTDLAVLKIALDRLPSIALGDSNRLRVGDVVLAMGNALGIGQTVTQGIVSATGRNRVGINTFENFIQTDAAINFGNSGGALVNSRGELIGINSARLESEGIGFAIPTSIALRIARQILDSGSVERGWLGIDARDLDDNLKRTLGLERGIVVLGILNHGPAAQAGVRPGDVLTDIGGLPMFDSHSAIERIAAYKPGSRITLAGIRDGAPFSTMVTVSRRPPRE